LIQLRKKNKIAGVKSELCKDFRTRTSALFSCIHI